MSRSLWSIRGLRRFINRQATTISQRWLPSFSLTGVYLHPAGPGFESEVLSHRKRTSSRPSTTGISEEMIEGADRPGRTTLLHATGGGARLKVSVFLL